MILQGAYIHRVAEKPIRTCVLTHASLKTAVVLPNVLKYIIYQTVSGMSAPSIKASARRNVPHSMPSQHNRVPSDGAHQSIAVGQK
jgi:hypothetical protein